MRPQSTGRLEKKPRTAKSTTTKGPAAKVGRHDVFAGKEVSFKNGRIVVKSQKLAKALRQFFLDETQGIHAAVIELRTKTAVVEQTEPEVTVDCRC